MQWESQHTRRKQKRLHIVLCMFFVIPLILFVMLSVAYTEAKDKKVATTSQEGQGIEEKWGIKIQSLRATAEGFMLDFRYRIIDPEKSKMLLDRNAKPYLLNQATGEKMPVVRSRFGPIRHTTAKPTVDRNYSILFSNMNKSVKKGDKVTIVIGEFKAENLVVEAVEPPVPASGNPVHEASTTTKTDAVEEEFTNPKNPVEVTAGQNFTIILGANHTTGYRWEIAHGIDKSIVELVGSVYEASDTKKVGSGGREVWTFLAKSPGKTKVSYEYVRPWEKQAGPAKTTSLEIIVK